MRFIIFLLAVTLALTFSVQAQTTPESGTVNIAEYQKIIETRCTVCHSAERIEQALREGRNIDEIMQKMIQMGAVLNENEKSVLGTFWGSPLKE